MATTVECKRCFNVLSPCCGGSTSSESFSGLLVTVDSAVFKIYAPFEVTYTANSAILSDMKGNRRTIALADTPYGTIATLRSIIDGCKCPSASGIEEVTVTYTAASGTLAVDVDGVNDSVVVLPAVDHSIVGAGTTGSPFILSGDQDAPGANKVYGTDGAGVKGWKNDPAGGGASVSFDALTSGTVTAQVTRLGGSAVTIANPASGEYNLVVPAGAHLNAVSIFGNNTTLNASNEMIIRVNNSANARDRRVLVQLYDATNGALVDQQATGTVHTQAVSGNITTITIPGLNGFGAGGYRVEIR